MTVSTPPFPAGALAPKRALAFATDFKVKHTVEDETKSATALGRVKRLGRKGRFAVARVCEGGFFVSEKPGTPKTKY